MNGAIQIKVIIIISQIQYPLQHEENLALSLLSPQKQFKKKKMLMKLLFSFWSVFELIFADGSHVGTMMCIENRFGWSPSFGH